jgi:hypothetical protein
MINSFKNANIHDFKNENMNIIKNNTSSASTLKKW